jgi:hypothetical protein
MNDDKIRPRPDPFIVGIIAVLAIVAGVIAFSERRARQNVLQKPFVYNISKLRQTDASLTLYRESDPIRLSIDSPAAVAVGKQQIVVLTTLQHTQIKPVNSGYITMLTG